VRKKVITPWCNLKSAFQHKTKPSGLRKPCYAEEILWNIKEWTPSFNCLRELVGDGKSDLAMEKKAGVTPVSRAVAIKQAKSLIDDVLGDTK
jgi:hypothetical protein